jgi:alkanesulfonate monooxygenase SsuD/methylene tetrahydromethanopterin reductase-like flavin-dependent oxidoreductase (luciferase family)
VLSPEEVRRGLELVRAGAREAGRDLADFEVAPQLVVAVGLTAEEAEDRLRRSQLFRHLVSLRRSTLRAQDLARVEERALVGTPEDICRQVEAYRAAGVTHLAGLLFAADTLAEFRQQMRLFGREVVAAFPESDTGGQHGR